MGFRTSQNEFSLWKASLEGWSSALSSVFCERSVTGRLLHDQRLLDPSALVGESQQYLCLLGDLLAFLSFSASVQGNRGPDLSDSLSHGPPTTQGGSSNIRLNVCWEWGQGEPREKGFGNGRGRHEKKSAWGQSSYKCPTRKRGWDEGKGK